MFFSPSLLDSAFLFWSSCGINTFHDLYIDGTFASFQHIRDKFSQSIIFSDTYKFVVSLGMNFQIFLSYQIFFVFFLIVFFSSGCTRKGLISQIYFQIHSLCPSICISHSLILCKVVYHVNFTNARLAKVSPACDRCCQDPANLIQMFWLCP